MAQEGEGPDFMSRFIAANEVPEESIIHFSSIPWTNEFLSNPLYQIIPPFSRVLKPTGEDYFFSRTINSPSTIHHMVCLQLKDYPNVPDTSSTTTTTTKSHLNSNPNPIPTVTIKSPTPVPSNPDTIFLLRIGSPGVDGHPGVAHGGMASAILDETMGLCVMLHHQQISGPRELLFTATLKVTYRAPIQTPGEVMVRSWLVAKQGRKWFSIGQIVDRDGNVLTEGEALWVLKKGMEKL